MTTTIPNKNLEKDYTVTVKYNWNRLIFGFLSTVVPMYDAPIFRPYLGTILNKLDREIVYHPKTIYLMVVPSLLAEEPDIPTTFLLKSSVKIVF